MKKILQIIDTYDWAIGSLAKAVLSQNKHFEWKKMAIHPKDLEQGKIDLGPIIAAIKWCDIVDAEYWRTLSQLIELIPELKDKPILLSHHNEKNLLSYEWPENVIHVATTRYSEKVLKEHFPNGKVWYVPNSYDHRLFKYNTEYNPAEKVVGYVGRIVPWKGLKNVARACYELGYPLEIMGKMDKPSYFDEIPQEHKENMRWNWFNCKPEERPDYFKEISVYVGNSGGGRETGPLGLMEAMACGVPVVSTPSGIAADIGEDDVNMLLVDYDDYEGLKEAIGRVLEHPQLAQRLRKSGWETIRGFNDDRRGMLYRKIYNEIFYKRPLVSVIIPTTHERGKETLQILDALQKQTYTEIEAIVVFDQAVEDSKTSLFSEAVKPAYSFPIHVLETNTIGGYNLALARNLGVIEADGDYILFCDSRLCPKETAVQEFMDVIKTKKPEEKVWLFGEKGGDKKHFVENFSFISRKHVIAGGMFNERITRYGGMSQELRERFRQQGFNFGYVPTAEAVQMCKSSLSQDKRDGIIEMKNLLYKLDLV